MVLFGSFYPLWCYLVHIGPIQLTLVLFGLICSNLVHYVYFGPNLSIRSYSVHIGPLCLIRSTLVLLGPVSSTLYSVQFVPFGPIQSICVHFGSFVPLWLILVYFNLFLCTYIWVESTYSKSKFIYLKNTNLKLIISKILSIVFIVTTLLLSHINVAFQSISIRLNLSESLSKHKSYEYTNLIFRVVTHLF